jgi:hypothetical protein
MELFIPSLIVIILGAVVFFVVLPKMAPYTLGVAAICLFVLGAFQHYQTFPYEYTSGNFREVLQDYSGFIMLIATILGFTIAIMLVYGGNPPPISSMPGVSSLPEMPSLPSLPSFGNSGAKNSFGLGGNNSKRNSLASNSFKVT